jgi:predicted DNA-binding protein (MmcQ/YjbR family)
MPRPPRKLSPAAERVLIKLRKICEALPRVEEISTFGNPGFKAGRKAFAILDFYQGQDCLWLRIDPAERTELLARPGWFASPYDPRKTALCCELSAVKWNLVKPLVRRSYALSGEAPNRSVHK